MSLKAIIIITLITTVPAFTAPVSTTAKIAAKAVSAAKKSGKFMKSLFKAAPKKALLEHGDDVVKVSKTLKTVGKTASQTAGKEVVKHADDMVKLGAHADDMAKALVHGGGTAVNAAKGGIRALGPVMVRNADEAIEHAARLSGKMLTPMMKKTTEQALASACMQYGDDVVLKVVANGGLEAIEQGVKHGEAFWRLGAQAPEAARMLVLYTDELLPIAKRIGPEFLRLESHVPGLGMKAVSSFGDDAVKFLAKLPAGDATRIIAYGAKADSPMTAQLLLKACKNTGNAILNHLDRSKIIAYGLTGSMVTAAWRLTGTVDKISQELVDGVKTDPVTTKQIIEHISNRATLPFIIISVGSVIILGYLMQPIGKWLHTKLAVPQNSHPIIDVQPIKAEDGK